MTDPKEMAAQLRSPHGENAIMVGDFMVKANEKLYLKLVDLLQSTMDSSILEIGPGNGTYISSVLSSGTNLKYTAIDLSAEMVSSAREINKVAIDNGSVQIIHGDCRKMSFNDNSFDHIIGLNTIYFWDPIELYLSEIKRVMKTGAKLYLGYRTRESMMGLSFTRFGFSLYERTDLERALAEAGFGSTQSVHFQEEITDQEGRKQRLDSVFTVASLL